MGQASAQHSGEVALASPLLSRTPHETLQDLRRSLVSLTIQLERVRSCYPPVGPDLQAHESDLLGEPLHLAVESDHLEAELQAD